MKELELIKTLLEPKFKGLAKIKSPYIKDGASNIEGYYYSKFDDSLSFYGFDKIGWNLRQHHNCLRVRDYRDIFRSLVKVDEGSYEIRLSNEEIFPQGIDLPISIQGADACKIMSINPLEWVPGDFFQEDDGTILESIIGISITTENVRVVTFNPLTLESEVYTYQNMEELEDHIFTLIPIPMKV